MNKLIQFIVIFISFSFLFPSCDNSDNDDDEAPQIIKCNISDTLYLGLSSSEYNRIQIEFSDNEALSSYNIYIKPDPDYFGQENNSVIDSVNMDSLAYEGIINSKLKVDIFGLKTATIKTSLYGISSKFTIYDRTQNKTKSYLMRSGQYLLSVECLDMAGNSTKRDVKSVCILYPDSTLITNS